MVSTTRRMSCTSARFFEAMPQGCHARIIEPFGGPIGPRLRCSCPPGDGRASLTSGRSRTSRPEVAGRDGFRIVGKPHLASMCLSPDHVLIGPRLPTARLWGSQQVAAFRCTGWQRKGRSRGLSGVNCSFPSTPPGVPIVARQTVWFPDLCRCLADVWEHCHSP